MSFNAVCSKSWLSSLKAEDAIMLADRGAGFYLDNNFMCHQELDSARKMHANLNLHIQWQEQNDVCTFLQLFKE